MRLPACVLAFVAPDEFCDQQMVVPCPSLTLFFFHATGQTKTGLAAKSIWTVVGMTAMEYDICICGRKSNCARFVSNKFLVRKISHSRSPSLDQVHTLWGRERRLQSIASLKRVLSHVYTCTYTTITREMPTSLTPQYKILPITSPSPFPACVQPIWVPLNQSGQSPSACPDRSRPWDPALSKFSVGETGTIRISHISIAMPSNNCFSLHPVYWFVSATYCLSCLLES